MIFARASRAAKKIETDLEVHTQRNTLTFGFSGHTPLHVDRESNILTEERRKARLATRLQ